MRTCFLPCFVGVLTVAFVACYGGSGGGGALGDAASGGAGGASAAVGGSGAAAVGGAAGTGAGGVGAAGAGATGGGASGGVSGGTSGGVGSPVTFTSGGITLTVTTTITGDTAHSVVVNGSGETLLEAEVTGSTVRLVFPLEGGVESVTALPEAIAGIPSDLAANRLAVFIAGQLYSAEGAGARPDNPGCDFFPDTRCTLRCCADHDRCFADNGCSFTSWIPGVGSEACRVCNSVAQDCILRSCWEGGEGDAASDVCFDAACRMSYTCPNDPFDCYACTSPCGAPDSCGNGTCEVTESPETCASDCAGGVNICCLETGNCPSETPDTCPGSCCCCGLGEVCGASMLCDSSGGSVPVPAP